MPRAVPEHRHRICVLRDGSRVLVRPILPADADRLVAGFEALSPRSRYQRFLMPVTQLSAEQVRFLTEIDYHDHMAWVALALGEPGEPGAGVARYVRLPDEPTVAEAAVTVADRYQGRGLGTLLLGMLAASALESGIEVFRNYVLASNAAMVSVFESLGATAEAEDEDVVRIDMALTDDVDDLPDTPAGRVFREVATRTRQPALLDGPITFFRRLAGVPDVTLPADRTPRGAESPLLAEHLDATFSRDDDQPRGSG
jgi:RimJ/RimL family protein N-acetyltransferase